MHLEAAFEAVASLRATLVDAVGVAESVSDFASKFVEAVEEAADALDGMPSWDHEMGPALDTATAAISNLREAVERLSDEWESEILSKM